MRSRTSARVDLLGKGVYGAVQTSGDKLVKKVDASDSRPNPHSTLIETTVLIALNEFGLGPHLHNVATSTRNRRGGVLTLSRYSNSMDYVDREKEGGLMKEEKYRKTVAPPDMVQDMLVLLRKYVMMWDLGFVHLDAKTSNILVCSDMSHRTTMTDFGISAFYMFDQVESSNSFTCKPPEWESITKPFDMLKADINVIARIFLYRMMAPEKWTMVGICGDGVAISQRVFLTYCAMYHASLREAGLYDLFYRMLHKNPELRPTVDEIARCVCAPRIPQGMPPDISSLTSGEFAQITRTIFNAVNVAAGAPVLKTKTHKFEIRMPIKKSHLLALNIGLCRFLLRTSDAREMSTSDSELIGYYKQALEIMLAAITYVCEPNKTVSEFDAFTRSVSSEREIDWPNIFKVLKLVNIGWCCRYAANIIRNVQDALPEFPHHERYANVFYNTPLLLEKSTFVTVVLEHI